MRINTWENFTIPNQEDYGKVEKFYYREDESPVNERQTLFLACPKKSTKPFPSLIWLHGGGFIDECIDEVECFYDGTRAVVSLRYRLSCDNIVPAPLEDVAAAIGWIKKHIAEYGGDSERIVLGGMSAGAWLAAMIGMAPEYLAKYGIDHKKLCGLLLICGQMTTHFQVKKDLNYSGENQLPVIDRYAPMHYLSKELPPILMAVGQHDKDIPGRTYENFFMADMLRALGHKHLECYSSQGIGHCVQAANPAFVLPFLQSINC